MTESTFALTFFAPVSGLRAKTVPTQYSRYVSEDRIFPSSSVVELKEHGTLLVLSRYPDTGGYGPVLSLMLCRQIYETGGTTGRGGHAFGVQISVWGRKLPSAEFLESSLRETFILLRDSATDNGLLKVSSAFEAFVSDYEAKRYDQFVRAAEEAKEKSVHYLPDLGIQPNGDIGFLKADFERSAEATSRSALLDVMEWAMHSPRARIYQRVIVGSEQACEAGSSVKLIPGPVRLGVADVVGLAVNFTALSVGKQALEATNQALEADNVGLRDQLKNTQLEAAEWKSKFSSPLKTPTPLRTPDSDLAQPLVARLDRLSREISQLGGMMERNLKAVDGEVEDFRSELTNFRGSSFWWRLGFLAFIVVVSLLAVGIEKKFVAEPIAESVRAAAKTSGNGAPDLTPILVEIAKLRSEVAGRMRGIESQISQSKAASLQKSEDASKPLPKTPSRPVSKKN